MFPCLHTVLSYIVSWWCNWSLGWKWSSEVIGTKGSMCSFSYLCSQKARLACWLSSMSSDFVTSVSGPLGLCLHRFWSGAEEASWRLGKVKGSLQCSFSTCIRDLPWTVCANRPWGSITRTWGEFPVTLIQLLEETYIAKHLVLRGSSLWQVQNIFYPGADGWDVFLVIGTDPGAEECEPAGFIFIWNCLKIYSGTA